MSLSMSEESGYSPGFDKTIVGYPVRAAIGSPYLATWMGK